MTWYDTAYRKLYFDFHSQETAVGLASAFDAERWADQVASAHAQAILVFCTCHFGWSYYRRGKLRYVHPHMPEGLDIVGDQIEALHRRGIKAIGYYHVLGSDPICRERPEWRQRNVNGKLVGNEICMQGPFLEAYFLPHVEEIVTNYPLDALFFDGLKANPECRCQSCGDRFLKEVGGPLPVDQNDPQWASFVKWRLEDIRGIRQVISDRIHRHRRELIVSYNWSYTMRIPESVPLHVGALGADILPDDQMFNGSYDARGWATKGVPFDVMNSAHLKGWWGDWGCKPATGMKHEVATAIANGGLTWIGYQMTHTFEVAPAVMAEMGKTLGFVKERESLLVDAEPRACVAVLHTEDAHFNRGPMLRVDSVSQRGVHNVGGERIPSGWESDCPSEPQRVEYQRCGLRVHRGVKQAGVVCGLHVWVLDCVLPGGLRIRFQARPSPCRTVRGPDEGVPRIGEAGTHVVGGYPDAAGKTSRRSPGVRIRSSSQGRALHAGRFDAGL